MPNPQHEIPSGNDGGSANAARTAAAQLIASGRALSDAGDYDAAIADYDRAIAINPDDAAAYYNRGLAKAGKGDYDAAIADCERAGALDDECALTLTLLHPLRAEIEQLQRQLTEKEAESQRMRIALRNMSSEPSRPTPAHVGAKPDAVTVVYYQNGPEYYPFLFDWLAKRSTDSQKRIRNAIAQMRNGNFGDSKSVYAAGLFERRLRSGERIYYAKTSATSVVILHGNDKGETNLDRDIAIALERWDDYQQQQR